MKKLLTILLFITISMTFVLGQDCEISGLWVAFANSWIEGGATVYEYPGVFEGQSVEYEEREYYYFTEDGLVAWKWVSIEEGFEEPWEWLRYTVEGDSIIISGMEWEGSYGLTLEQVSNFPEGAEYQHSGCMLSLEEPSEDEWTRNFLPADIDSLKSDVYEVETPALPYTGLWLGFVSTMGPDTALGFEWPAVFKGQDYEEKWRDIFYLTPDGEFAQAWYNPEEIPDSLEWSWGNYEIVGDSIVISNMTDDFWNTTLSLEFGQVWDFPSDTMEYTYTGSIMGFGGPEFDPTYTWYFLHPGEADSLQDDIADLVTPPESQTAIEHAAIEKPGSYKLGQNYPNPFNPVTTIKYNLPKQSNVKIAVYNMLGEKVEELINEVKSAGYNTVQWNASGFSSGLYFYRIKAGNFSAVKKCILVK